MARCKNITALFVPAGRNRMDVKAIIQCGWESHESDQPCAAIIADSNPSAMITWTGTHDGKPPQSNE